MFKYYHWKNNSGYYRKKNKSTSYCLKPRHWHKRENVASWISLPVSKIPQAFQPCHLGKQPPFFLLSEIPWHLSGLTLVSFHGHWKPATLAEGKLQSTEVESITKQKRLADLAAFIPLRKSSIKPNKFLKHAVIVWMTFTIPLVNFTRAREESIKLNCRPHVT